MREFTFEEAIKYVEINLNSFDYLKEEKKIRTKYDRKLAMLLKKYRDERDRSLTHYQKVRWIRKRIRKRTKLFISFY